VIDRADRRDLATAVVIVNYESGTALADCVASFSAQSPTELIVVDNGSSDGSVEGMSARFPDVAVLTTGENLGYGAAANRGVAATTAPSVLICNPDLEVGIGTLATLTEALGTHQRLAVVGPMIRNPDGEWYPSARRFPSMVDAAGHALLGIFAPDNRFTRSYQQSHLGSGAADLQVVDWVSGACFLISRAAFESVGGFDESYFMYAEDVDLCWRLGRNGWHVAYVPGAEVTHVQGLSTDRHPYRMVFEHHRSLLRFANRSSQGWRKALLPLVAVGIVVRAALACTAKLTRA
jgi:N-acetylglucosaminyl-diphospho-decaprenol L-rhamnosyltransferase